MENITSATLTTWLTELGPILDLAEVRQLEPDHWVLFFDEQSAVHLEHLPDEGKAVLSAELGRALPGAEAATYQLLLQVNTLWRETGGLHMALDAGDGELTQVYDIALVGLDRDALARRVRNFATAAHGWREVIATQATSSDSSAAPPDLLTRV